MLEPRRDEFEGPELPAGACIATYLVSAVADWFAEHWLALAAGLWLGMLVTAGSAWVWSWFL